MKLCSQSEGPLRMIADARSQIMEAPMSPAARIISTTMPSGPGALPAFICEIAFLTISGDWDGRAFHWWLIRQVVWVLVKLNVEKSL